jgi:hypothetical protein
MESSNRPQTADRGRQQAVEYEANDKR